MPEKPPMRCRGETGNGRESGCRNRKRCKTNIDTVHADSDQQNDNKEIRRGAHDVFMTTIIIDPILRRVRLVQ